MIRRPWTKEDSLSHNEGVENERIELGETAMTENERKRYLGMQVAMVIVTILLCGTVLLALIV